MIPVRRLFRSVLPFLFALYGCLAGEPALASPPPMVVPPESEIESGNANGYGAFDFMDGIDRSQTALGSMWGLRPWLSQYGLSLGIQETSEVLGNVSGGVKQGFDYDGLTQMSLQMDTQRAFGFYGGTFDISALQLHGENLSARNLDSLQTSSGIESPRSTRLWEMWYDQKFLDEDRLDIKVGQQSLDNEYMVSSNALLFVNTMFGWPMLPTADMPGGGPAYPLSALGIRAQARPSDSLTFLAGVYNGSPANKAGVNDSGTGFPLDGGTLAIAEMQYHYPSLGSMVGPDEARPLSGTYKIGMWYDTENFPDEAIDNTGASLALAANPALQHHGDYAFYAVADQMIWQDDEPQEADRTLNVFARAMGTPLADRNLIDFSMNAGLVLHEPFEHRDDDSFGIGMGYAHVSSSVAAFDNASSALGTYTPTQTGETFVEATYQYQVFPWWQVQPDFQYIFNPGGGILDPNTGARVGDEAIVGVRTNIAF